VTFGALSSIEYNAPFYEKPYFVDRNEAQLIIYCCINMGLHNCAHIL